jgi:hypothetical protein
LSDVNRRIITLERATAATQMATLDNEIALKEAELSAHAVAAPTPIAVPETATTSPALDAAIEDRRKSEERLEAIKEQLADGRARRAKALDLESRLFAFSETATRLKDEAREGLEELDLQFEDVVQVQIDAPLVISRRQSLEEEIVGGSEPPDSTSTSWALNKTSSVSQRLSTLQRAYQR